MGLNETPSSERVHIGFFGPRNAGKSSLVNAVTNQALSIVSDTPGTTTDPVYKTMELLPLGPVMIIDTPGYDDTGALGAQRVAKTYQVLRKIDIAVLVVDGIAGLGEAEHALLDALATRGIPHVIAYTKADLVAHRVKLGPLSYYTSASTGEGIEVLKEAIGALRQDEQQKKLVADLLQPNDCVVLVAPIDDSAPKGRLILPQQQVIRDILDHHATVIVVQPEELAAMLGQLKRPPTMVITDAQVFHTVADVVPESIPLTAFSILMARYKGILTVAAHGAAAIYSVADGDRVLMAEGCTHHRQCNDIGTVKLPRLLQKRTGKTLQFDTCSGTEFPDDLSPYQLVIHCGGCMQNDREIQYRLRTAQAQGVPFTNYGVALAHLNGILARSIASFPELQGVVSGL